MASDSSALKHDLETSVRGRVHAPGDPSWDDARRAWNLSVDQHPAAVVEVADADDVAAAVRTARRRGLPVVAQSTGHAATEDGVRDALLLRMHALDSVEIDADNHLARVGGGAMWGSVLDQLDGTGLLALSGTAPMISVAGYTLGGGLSWFSREYGVASGAVRSADLVTAEGEHETVTATSDPELFWALRGFGGEFGIVTSMEFALYPSPGVIGARTLFPADDAPAVLAAFAEMTAKAPRGFSAAATILHLPDIPVFPEERRGRSFVAVIATHLGTLDECRDHMSGVLAAGTPVENVIETVKLSELGVVAGDPVDPSPGVDRGMLLRRFDEPTIGRLLDTVGPGSGTRLLGVGIRHLGGALSDARCGHGGVAGVIEEPYLMFGIGIPGPSGSVPEIVDAQRQLQAALGDAAADRAPYNFLGRSGVDRAYDAATLERLRTLKAHRDPDGLFRMTRGLR